jgi:hypothetical protein
MKTCGARTTRLAARAAGSGAAIVLACALLLPTGGCKTLKFPANAGKGRGDPKAGLPQGVTGSDWHIVWRTVNPLHRNGKTWDVLDARAKSGQMSDEADDDRVVLRDARALLYRNGKPGAEVTSPLITASQKGHWITGIGGARLISMADPPGVVVTADHLRWDSKTGVIVATGNAKVVRHAARNVAPFVQTGSRVTYSPTLKQFTVE